MNKLSLSGLTMLILQEDGDLHRTNHFLKVCGYASVLGEREGMDEAALNRLQAAALLHDIGIRPSLEKYGSGAGEYQQKEGPPIARRLLEQVNCPQDDIERICYLIAHHHEYTGIDGIDYQILVEADFLVNCDEGEYPPAQIASVRKKVFRTATGKQMLDRLYKVSPQATHQPDLQAETT